MTRDEIMTLVNECAPLYQPWGIEAHFQLFAQRLLEIEREACARIAETAASSGAHVVAEAIRARGGDTLHAARAIRDQGTYP